METWRNSVKILGIESSCDETSAAIISDNTDSNKRILSNIIYSQIEIHKQYGGVIPEYAARNHLENIDSVIKKAFNNTLLTLNDIDVIAATAGPGLIGGLLVGLVTAKTIALMLKKPFIAVNHLEAHILTPRLCCPDLSFPYLVLLASGGNFIFAEVKNIGEYNVLGETLDDAAGEAFDKVAKMLGFPYPGGPSIEKAALMGNSERFNYTIPLQKQSGCNGSFSGLKTATRLYIEKLGNKIKNQDKYDIAASFQKVVVNFIEKQFNKALKMTSQPVKNIVIAGGVAANSLIRNKIQNLAVQNNLDFFAPPVNLCSDNAAMIGWCALERIKAGFACHNHMFKPKPRWPISEI